MFLETVSSEKSFLTQAQIYIKNILSRHESYLIVSCLLGKCGSFCNVKLADNLPNDIHAIVKWGKN